MKRWVGRAFDPEQLELEKTNKTLAVLARRLDKALWGQQRRS